VQTGVAGHDLEEQICCHPAALHRVLVHRRDAR
jgi:hypothetical protein